LSVIQDVRTLQQSVEKINVEMRQSTHKNKMLIDENLKSTHEKIKKIQDLTKELTGTLASTDLHMTSVLPL
jgi:Zn-dependent M16 (insulinase) family peptidase